MFPGLGARFPADSQKAPGRGPSEAETHHADAVTHAKLDDLARRMETLEEALRQILRSTGPSATTPDEI
jgi:hypothetical protein